jgi:hypothetical protein
MKERQINTMMSSRASSLLRKASGGFEPSATDRSKTRAAIARRMGVGLAAGAAVSAAAKSAAAAPSIAPAALAPAAVIAPTATAPVAAGLVSVGFATKLVAAMAIVGTVSAGAVTVHHVTRNANRMTAPTTIVNAPPNVAVASPIQVASSDVQQSAVQPAIMQQTAAPVSIDEGAAPVAPVAIATSPSIANTLQNKPVQKIENDSPKPKTAAPALQAGAETELFQRAQLALQADDATTALALLNEHAQRFPNGQLAEECDAARVLALCGAGQQIEAAAAGAAFLKAHPDSMQAARVRSSCANGQTTQQ